MAFLGNLRNVVIASFVLAILLVGLYCAIQGFDHSIKRRFFFLDRTSSAPASKPGARITSKKSWLIAAAVVSWIGRLRATIPPNADLLSVASA